jgi:hypothetical protein
VSLDVAVPADGTGRGPGFTVERSDKGIDIFGGRMEDTQSIFGITRDENGVGIAVHPVKPRTVYPMKIAFHSPASDWNFMLGAFCTVYRLDHEGGTPQERIRGPHDTGFAWNHTGGANPDPGQYDETYAEPFELMPDAAYRVTVYWAEAWESWAWTYNYAVKQVLPDFTVGASHHYQKTSDGVNYLGSASPSDIVLAFTGTYWGDNGPRWGTWEGQFWKDTDSDEVVRISQYVYRTWEVERGYGDTPIEAHASGATWERVNISREVWYPMRTYLGDFVRRTNWHDLSAEGHALYDEYLHSWYPDGIA